MGSAGRLVLLLALSLLSSPAAGEDRAGARAFQYCYACHSVDPAETGLPGPNLHGVLGRPVASQDGFGYSPAMRAFARREPVWTVELLDAFIADPEALVPATEMSFHGIADARERAALIRFLREAAD